MVHCSDYRPSAAQLRDSLAKRSREFVLENSLHVVPYLAEPSRSIYERFLWFLIFNVSVISAVATIMTIWQKFQTSPTLTYLQIERENSTLDFPNVYLCFDESHLNFSELHLTPLQVEILRSLYKWKAEPLGYENEDAEDFGSFGKKLLQVAPECGQFFSYCGFGKEAYDCGDLFTRKVATPDGVCCEFESRTINKDDSFWSLRFLPSQYPISVHVTGKSEGPPICGQEPTHVMNGSSYIQLNLLITKTASSVHFLTRSQRKCAFSEESVSHVDCERTHVKNAIKSKCDCLPWFYASNPDEECHLNEYQCIFGIGIDQLIDHNCYISCDYIAYDCKKIERRDIGSIADTSEIYILTWPSTSFRRSTRFGWLDLIVSFGGVAGCFLGYSIINSLESVYYFTLRTYCGAVLSKPKTRFNIQVQPNDSKMNKASLENMTSNYPDLLKHRYFKDY